MAIVLAQQAVRNFLSRKLRDSNRAKSIPSKRIDQLYQELDPPRMPFPLRHHQKVSVLLGVKHPHYLYFLDPGLGKSLISLVLFRYARRTRRSNRPKALVLVPNASNLGQWVDEVKKHCPHFHPVMVDATGSDQRWQQVEEDRAHLVIMTYMGLLALIRREDGPKGKWVQDPKKIKRLTDRFDFLVGDECTAFANPHSLTHRVLRQLGKRMTWTYGLTGTPFGSDPHDLWGQFRVVDQGETLGPTLGLFRAALFNEHINYWGGSEWIFDQRKKGKLARLIRHNSLRYEETECNDLPKLVKIERVVDFPKETWQYYDRLVQELKNSKSSFQVVDSAFFRMRSLTAGYLAVKDPTGEKVEIKFKENPKLDALLADLADIPKERKAVIFHEYKTSGQILCEALKKQKIKSLWLHGGMGKKASKIVERFKTDPSIRVLVSSSAGAYGGNWQIANYLLFFETPCDPRLVKQEWKRCHRMGQVRRVMAFFYQVRGSVDQRIRQAHRRGMNLFASVVDGQTDFSILDRSGRF